MRLPEACRRPFCPIDRTADVGERGAVALHYGLLLALIAVACVGGVLVMGGWANDLFDSISRQI